MFVWKIVTTIAIATNHYLIYFESVGWSTEFRRCVVDVCDVQSYTQLSLGMYKMLDYESCHASHVLAMFGLSTFMYLTEGIVWSLLSAEKINL